MASHTDDIHTVDDDAYEPTYAEAFPPLPESEVREAPPIIAQGQWNKQLSLRSTVITQLFHVPLEERKYREMSEQRFGDQGDQSKICADIMKSTGVAIELSLGRDQSLTVMITGKKEGVMHARQRIVRELQVQANLALRIPREHHRHLLGRNGQKLRDLELVTATKISLPRQDDGLDVIKITGSKEGIEQAAHEIRMMSDEQAKLAFERLKVEKEYHPFIRASEPYLKSLQEKSMARIHIPPPSASKDEIVVSGEKEGVIQAKQAVLKIYEEKKRKCQTVSVEVRKSQHRYVIGPKGSNILEILQQTGVSVEVPLLDSTSETITLRGEQDKLGPALTMVYSKANSVVIEEVEAPSWLHRFIIGRKGVNIQKITQDLPKVHIEFTDDKNRITVEGPPEEVEQAKRELEVVTKDLMSRMDFTEIRVDQKYHRHIIGRQGSNVTRIKNETGVAIRVPQDSDVIRIEGTPHGVASAKQELLDMVQKMENEKTRDIIIEQRFHRQIIGSKGEKIREIRDKFNQVQIMLPDAIRKSDVVTLRGPKNDVDKCFKYLQMMQTELLSNNYQADVHIFKQFHKNIIGKGGANIKKIREETDTRIDLPSEANDSDTITITGKKAQVEKAKSMIEAMQKDLANIKEITIDIPFKLHNSIIGAKGRLIRSVMEDCGGVIIRFPPEGTNNDKVVIRGPTDDVEKARKQLQELSNERKEAGFTAELRAKPEYHKFLIGRGGANIRKVRDRTGARIIFPTHNDTDQELITIIGKKDMVQQAKTEIEQIIKDLDNVIEGELNVDPKYHRHFVARRGEVLRQIGEDFGGVTVSFPRSGVKSEKVILKGARECVEGAKKRILDIIHDLESQVTIECVIPQKYHSTVMGSKGHKVQDITRDWDVNIKFPDKPKNGEVHDQNEATVNGDVGSETGSEADKENGVRRQDIILVTGKKESCESARDALQALVPVTKEVCVPFDFHRFIIGTKGRDVRHMMDEFDVQISVPPARDQSDVVRVTGAPTNVDQAIAALSEKVETLEHEKEDRELRSHHLKVEVDPKYHPKIIGRKGAVITKIRQDHDVQIQFPERGDPNQDCITITGYEKNTLTAKEDILRIVNELEDMITEEVTIDHRVHSRLIGTRGRAIRKIMDDFKVDIKFPRADQDDPDHVYITGLEENVLECKDQLLNMEEEFLQDINERSLMQQYLQAPSRRGNSNEQKVEQRGFKVREAPWDARGLNAPDTSSTEDFPGLGSASAPRVSPTQSNSHTARAWGPAMKR